MGFSKPLCAVAAGRARAAGEQGAAQSPQARAGGVGARRGAARAAPGPGEWSNLTAGTRRRRAAGNGGGGGGAGRHREAWAVTRAPERGPMVLEGPRRPVLQVRRAPRWAALCPGPGDGDARPASCARPARAPGAGREAEPGRRTVHAGLSAPPALGGAAFDRSRSAFETREKTGGIHAGRRAGVPGATRACQMARDPWMPQRIRRGTRPQRGAGWSPGKGLLCVYLAGDQGWPEGVGGPGHVLCPSPFRLSGP